MLQEFGGGPFISGANGGCEPPAGNAVCLVNCQKKLIACLEDFGFVNVP